MLTMVNQTLRERLSEWTDWDAAAFHLAQSLGLMAPDVDFCTRAKHVFWTDHPIGCALRDMLGRLVEAGVVEYRDEPDDQYRWRADFVGSWETRGGGPAEGA